MRPLAPRTGERFVGWLVTGPVGHLVAGVLDWMELLIRLGWARTRRARKRS